MRLPGLGIRSHLACSSPDANVPLSRGIPAIALGGGGTGGGAHTTQEWFRPEGRDLGLKRILLTILLCMRVRAPLRPSPGRESGTLPGPGSGK